MPKSKTWLKKHRRFVIHYVPTSCSWLNLMERWFAELTNKRIRRDSFYSAAYWGSADVKAARDLKFTDSVAEQFCGR